MAMSTPHTPHYWTFSILTYRHIDHIGFKPLKIKKLCDLCAYVLKNVQQCAHTLTARTCWAKSSHIQRTLSGIQAPKFHPSPLNQLKPSLKK